MEAETDNKRAIQIASDALAAVAGVGMAGLGGGFIFVGAAAVPVMSAALKAGFDRLRRLDNDLRSEASQVGLNEDELRQKVEADELLLVMYANVRTAVLTSDLNAKRIALGRALVRGILAQNRAAIDEEALVIKALMAVETLHVQALQLLRDAELKTEVERKEGRPVISPERMTELWPEASPGARSGVMAVLVAAGLAETLNRLDGTAWNITEFGHLLLGYLEAAESTPAD